MPDMAVFGCP